MVPVNTDLVPDSGPTVASRTTVMSGNAVLDAAKQLRARMMEVAAQKMDAPKEKLVARLGEISVDGGLKRLSFKDAAKACYERKVNLTAEGWYAPPRKEWNEAMGLGEAYSVYCFACQIAEVTVGTDADSSEPSSRRASPSSRSVGRPGITGPWPSRAITVSSPGPTT